MKSYLTICLTIWQVSTANIITKAAKIIKSGGLVVFPTETVYALAADCFNANSVDKIYEIKGRGLHKPLSLLVENIQAIEEIAHLNATERRLLKVFTPGPLTLVLNLKNHAAATIGVRIPNHPIAQAILKAVKSPIIGTSANLSGTNDHRFSALIPAAILDHVDLLIEDDNSVTGVGSSVIDARADEIKIIRPGQISIEDILSLAR
jgi:tRNA threonylcarbamoyl adenosine modification protein (Sua5/YciO/YrdC/YwlC family)